MVRCEPLAFCVFAVNGRSGNDSEVPGLVPPPFVPPLVDAPAPPRGPYDGRAVVLPPLEEPDDPANVPFGL